MESLTKPHSLSFLQGCGWWILAAILLTMPGHLRKRLSLNTIWPCFLLAGINCLISAFSDADFHIVENVDVHSLLLMISALLLAEFQRRTAFTDPYSGTAFGAVCITGTAFLTALPADFLHPAAHLFFGLGTAGIGLTLFRFGQRRVTDASPPWCILPLFVFLGVAITASYTSYYGYPISFLTTLHLQSPFISVDLLYVVIQFTTALCLQCWFNRVTDRSEAVDLAVAGKRIILAVLLLAVTGILLASLLASKLLSSLETETSSQAHALIDQVNGELKQDERLSLLVSQHPAVVSALSGGTSGDCDTVIRQCSEVTPNFTWFITDPKGGIFAASFPDRPVVLGSHTSRPYIDAAQAGRTGRYFGVGLISREPGHYTAQPVRSPDGRILGAVVVKRPTSTLKKFFERHQNALMISPDGIVFLGSRQEWEFKPIFPLSSDQLAVLKQTGQFYNIASSTLFGSQISLPGNIRLSGKTLFCVQRALNAENWRILIMNDMERIALSRHLPLAVTLSLIILTLAFHIGTARVAEKARQAVQFEQQFKSVFENAPEGILIIDANTHDILAANPFMTRTLGIAEPDAARKLRYEDICQEGDTHEFFQGIARGELAAVERHIRHTTGLTLYGEITGSSLKLRDRSVFLLFIRDLTSRRLLETLRIESEERFKKLFAAAPNGFILIRESNHTIVEVNAAALEMLGRSYDDVIGRVCHKFICPTEAGACPISDLHQKIDHSERLLIAQGGLRIPIIKQVIRLDLGGVPHLLENFIDIRQRKNMELALAGAKEAAEAANLEKSRFIAHMSHEIRTPMNALLGLIDVLHAELAIPRQKHYLDLIKSAGESLLALLNDILDFSKIGAGRMELDESLFDLPALIQTTLELLSGRAAAKRINLICELDPQLPRLVIGDQFRLRQILLNLLNNAIKFTDQGSVRVTAVRMSFEKSDSALIAMEVIDTGIGIPSDQISRLFKSFSQIRSGSATKQEGTGLGLTICKQLVQLMKGDISVQSEAGRGSRFRFTMRLRLPENGADFVSPRIAPPAGIESTGTLAPAVSAGPRGSILLAEDSEINRTLAETLLEARGWQVTPVGTGREIVELTADTDFDLVLADIQMPEMDGFEAVRAVREREKSSGKHIPMIALTAHASPSDKEACTDAGFDGYLPKPYAPERLFAVIGATLETVHRSGSLAVSIDLDHLMKRVCGDVGTLIRMIEIFVAKYPDQILALEDACRNSDLAGVSVKAHSLKGTIGTFASERVFQAISAVESAARTGSATDIASAMDIFVPLSREFVAELKLLQEKLRKEYGSVPESRPTA